MTINPNAQYIETALPCARCGGPIEGMFVVQLCDKCLDTVTPAHPCFVCGKMSKEHPRMTRFYDGDWRTPEGKLKPPRYFCEEHSDHA